ncbi:DUF72 domain-containing protein [Pedobacter changchengzhani]|uniref:DUF72 domain-containing protein n=1 Tax=Pedobacter changchengzhani TaxID=2529274 RepID=A0A4R5MJG4_9SPHI|nr:DUF72 domain-containing protein [Pedobacter changchengzhani]TDG35688.1 DUF72 domain-containing protein [Pedobacter changchengzhani]
MQFGKVEDPSKIDYTLPADAPETSEILKANKAKQDFKAYVGCAKWNKADLKGFYPKGTKDELTYYAAQFNSIELNATFYGMPTSEQVITWREKTPEDFKFFPKLTNTVSHFKRLINVKEPVEKYCDAISNFEDKLGMAFLQLHDNFKPKDFDRLKVVANEFPKVIPLGVEVRNEEWFSNPTIQAEFCQLFKENGITNILVDTSGRRDMLHMHLTTPTAFIRFVGANDDLIDKKRLDDWIERIVKWKKEGLENLFFFVHQNIELSSPLFSAYFIEKLNEAIGTDLTIPVMANGNSPQSLF